MANWIVFAIELLWHGFISCMLVECPSFSLLLPLPCCCCCCFFHSLLVHLLRFSFYAPTNRNWLFFMIFVNEPLTQNLLIVFLFSASHCCYRDVFSFYRLHCVFLALVCDLKISAHKIEKKYRDVKIKWEFSSKFYLYPEQEITHGFIEKVKFFYPSLIRNRNNSTITEYAKTNTKKKEKRNVWIEMDGLKGVAVMMHYQLNQAKERISNKIYCTKEFTFFKYYSLYHPHHTTQHYPYKWSFSI